MLDSLYSVILSFVSDIDGLIALIAWITGGWFILAGGLLVWFMIGSQKTTSPKQASLSSIGSAMAWGLIPAAGVLLSTLSITPQNDSAWNSVELDGGQLSSTDHLVKITGQQEGWLLTYPGLDGQFGSEDDILVDEFAMPTNFQGRTH